jgi:hypothetical protein
MDISFNPNNGSDNGLPVLINVILPTNPADVSPKLKELHDKMIDIFEEDEDLNKAADKAMEDGVITDNEYFDLVDLAWTSLQNYSENQKVQDWYEDLWISINSNSFQNSLQMDLGGFPI